MKKKNLKVDDRIFNSEDYFASAFVAEEARLEMLSRLKMIHITPQKILETGYNAVAVQKQYPDAHVWSFSSDLEDLLFQSKMINQSKIINICGNSASPPFKPASFDLIFTNLTLAYCSNIDELASVLLQWKKLLKPGGLLMFATLGPDTLAQFPEESLLIHKIDMHHIGDKLLALDFKDPVLDVNYLQVGYQSSEKMRLDLHQSRLLSLNYSKTPDALITEYEMIYGHAWNPDFDTQNSYPAEEGVVKIPVSVLKKSH